MWLAGGGTSLPSHGIWCHEAGIGNEDPSMKTLYY